ncbi:hypothetical protein [Anaplasma phagocytophilum]
MTDYTTASDRLIYAADTVKTPSLFLNTVRRTLDNSARETS